MPKPTLRSRIKALRASLDPSALASASHAIAERALALPPLREAGTVALYLPLPGEIDTRPLVEGLAARGARCLFPRVVRGSRVLSFSPIEGELQRGPLGLREPPPGAEVPLASIELFIVPGVAFDLRGGRLGRGGGYYDATLAAAPAALRVSLCLEGQIVDEVPRHAHDLPVDWLVTPERSVRCGGRQAR